MTASLCTHWWDKPVCLRVHNPHIKKFWSENEVQIVYIMNKNAWRIIICTSYLVWGLLLAVGCVRV